MIVYVTVGMLMAFLLGYIIGKRYGWEQGYNKAQAVVPLEIRQQSFEKGKCVICEELWNDARKCEIYRRELDTL